MPRWKVIGASRRRQWQWQQAAYLQNEPLLWVHELGLSIGNAKQAGVKEVHIRQESAMAHPQLGLASLHKQHIP